jgi:hypothetical protein
MRIWMMLEVLWRKALDLIYPRITPCLLSGRRILWYVPQSSPFFLKKIIIIHHFVHFDSHIYLIIKPIVQKHLIMVENTPILEYLIASYPFTRDHLGKMLLDCIDHSYIHMVQVIMACGTDVRPVISCRTLRRCVTQGCPTVLVSPVSPFFFPIPHIQCVVFHGLM